MSDVAAAADDDLMMMMTARSAPRSSLGSSLARSRDLNGLAAAAAAAAPFTFLKRHRVVAAAALRLHGQFNGIIIINGLVVKIGHWRATAPLPFADS